MLYTVLKMDAGPVLAVEQVPVDPNVQTPELLSDLFRMGTDLLVRSLPIVWEGRGLEASRGRSTEIDLVRLRASMLIHSF